MQNIPVACFLSSSYIPSMLMVSFVIFSLIVASAANFYQDFDITWGDRLWILGQFKWWPLLSAHQCIHKWQRWKRATISPLVWPYCWFSCLFHPLESSAHCVSTVFFPVVNLLRLITFFIVISSFSVDGTPIREFKNSESIGVPFPKNQPMTMYSSLRNADD